jgi:hypothetical protein
MHAHALPLRNREARFRLEEGDVDRLRLERGFDDVRGTLERRVDVAAGERRSRLQDVRGARRECLVRVDKRRVRLERLERIGDRLVDLIVDRDRCRRLARMELRIGDDHRQKVGDAAGHLPFGDEHRLVGIVQTSTAEAGHILRGEDARDPRHLLRLRGVDLQDLCARVLSEHHGAMQHA